MGWWNSRVSWCIIVPAPQTGAGSDMSTRHRHHASQARRIAAALALAGGLAPLGAQQAAPKLSGRVVDRVSATGIAGASIVLVGDGRRVATDSAGRFVFPSLTPGTIQLMIRAPLFPPVQLAIDMSAGDVTRTIVLDSTEVGPTPHALPAVAVSAAAPVSYRLTDFERRRRTGRGQYLSDEEIKASGAANLQDATRGMRGVTLHCGGTTEGGCRIQMVRAPMNCQPDYVIDGRIENMFGPATPIRDVVGIEVYTGPSDVPGEFAGRTAACGVVVVWTRFAPARRSP
jgi:hypothetical protein